MISSTVAKIHECEKNTNFYSKSSHLLDFFQTVDSSQLESLMMLFQKRLEAK